jgi:hypothetical protein
VWWAWSVYATCLDSYQSWADRCSLFITQIPLLVFCPVQGKVLPWAGDAPERDAPPIGDYVNIQLSALKGHWLTVVPLSLSLSPRLIVVKKYLDTRLFAPWNGYWLGGHPARGGSSSGCKKLSSECFGFLWSMALRLCQHQHVYCLVLTLFFLEILVVHLLWLDSLTKAHYFSGSGPGLKDLGCP